MITNRTALRAGLAALGLVALAACGQSEDAATYEPDVTDESAGNLIASEVDPSAVPVDLPETPMTPVPTEESAMPDATMTSPVATPEAPPPATPTPPAN
ncbi:hypothetical protein [Novosphingobium aquimarinum]|uniref:hypothetical protein n=1 Tax=Novosphingobium aquimarinum TaxID=2682494 RepID=UPI0018DEC116|nr:hypothetical protein [Novosphingobium aquimarinum]